MHIEWFEPSSNCAFRDPRRVLSEISRMPYDRDNPGNLAQLTKELVSS